MWRFPAQDELSVIADSGAFTDALAEDLGQSIHAYHCVAPRRELGGARLIADIVAELDHAFAGMHDRLGTGRVTTFGAKAALALVAATLLLDRRGTEGQVRRCHGDLHLRNLVLLDGKPVPFDALEFDEVLGTCDVLYDLAFLIMDLRHRHLPRAANIVLNTYLLAAQGDEDSGLAALPLFLAIRAAIRSMVVVQTDRAGGTQGKSDAEAGAFLDEAIALLDAPGARLIAVGGLSGTGKTTIARQIAAGIGAAPGAVHLRSDLERKAMEGVAVQTHLPLASYAKDARSKVYDRMFARAETILQAGHSALLDATFLDIETRHRAEALAARLHVPFTGLWLHAPSGSLLARVAARSADASDADASDADASVVLQQLEKQVGPIDWHQVDAGSTITDTVAAANAVLGLPR